MFSQYTAGQEECHRSLALDGPQTQSNGYQNQIRHQILISQSVANLEIYFQVEILKDKVFVWFNRKTVQKNNQIED